jgi:hypothetical protein
MKFAYSGDQWASDGIGCAEHLERADCWVFNVFNSYLGHESAAAVTAAISSRSASAANEICLLSGVAAPASWAACKAFSQTADAKSLYAGILHFNEDLDPGFHAMTVNVLGSRKTRGDITQALQAIRTQHGRLITDSVIPGFEVNFQNGGFLGISTSIAKWAVPFAAACFREAAIHDALAKSSIANVAGADYYAKATPPSVRDLYESDRCSGLRGALGVANVVFAKAKATRSGGKVKVSGKAKGAGKGSPVLLKAGKVKKTVSTTAGGKYTAKLAVPKKVKKLKLSVTVGLRTKTQTIAIH